MSTLFCFMSPRSWRNRSVVFTVSMSSGLRRVQELAKLRTRSGDLVFNNRQERASIEWHVYHTHERLSERSGVELPHLEVCQYAASGNFGGQEIAKRAGRYGGNPCPRRKMH